MQGTNTTGARPRLIVVGCGRSKTAEPAPAMDLYNGSLSRAAIGYAKASGADWVILSAKHGLISPERVIAPYDFTAAQRLSARALEPLCARSALWDEWLFHSIRVPLGGVVEDLGSGLTIELHAGASYAELLEYALTWGFVFEWCSRVTIEQPLAGLQIGERLAWYKRRREAGHA